MKKFISTMALACMMILPAAGYAQKIGYLNANVLLNEYARIKGIDKMIEDKFKGPKKDIEKMVSDMQVLEKEIKTNELLMTESKLIASKQKLSKMFAEYREKGMALEKELQVVRNEERTKFRKILLEVTKDYAIEKKYDLIVNEGVVYVSDSLDVTKDMIERVKKATK